MGPFLRALGSILGGGAFWDPCTRPLAFLWVPNKENGFFPWLGRDQNLSGKPRELGGNQTMMEKEQQWCARHPGARMPDLPFGPGLIAVPASSMAPRPPRPGGVGVPKVDAVANDRGYFAKDFNHSRPQNSLCLRSRHHHAK